MVAEKVVFGDALTASSRGHKGGIYAVVFERLDDVGGNHFVDLQLYLRIVLDEGGNKLMEQVGSDGRNNTRIWGS